MNNLPTPKDRQAAFAQMQKIVLEQVLRDPVRLVDQSAGGPRQRQRLRAVPHSPHVQRLVQPTDPPMWRRSRSGALLGAMPVLVIVSLITFGMIHLIPGDPAAAIAGMSADAGADRQYPARPRARSAGAGCNCWHWYADLAHGDLGRSLLLGQPVLHATLQRLPVTLALSAYALVLTLVLGLARGIVAALRQNTWIDQAAMVLAMIGISLPNFYLGLLMIILFAVDLRLAADRRLHPAVARPAGLAGDIDDAGDLAGAAAGRTARPHHPLHDAGGVASGLYPHRRAKGLPRRQVVLKHALANALIPITTVIGIIISLLISGVGGDRDPVLHSRHRPVADPGRAQPRLSDGAGRAVAGHRALLVLVNIGVDVCYALLDPRVRYDG